MQGEGVNWTDQDDRRGAKRPAPKPKPKEERLMRTRTNHTWAAGDQVRICVALSRPELVGQIGTVRMVYRSSPEAPQRVLVVWGDTWDAGVWVEGTWIERVR